MVRWSMPTLTQLPAIASTLGGVLFSNTSILRLISFISLISNSTSVLFYLILAFPTTFVVSCLIKLAMIRALWVALVRVG
ncbi:hypothetical protein B0O99DRAFT_617387 [Bisporella sp. PMI_857]|nr:hypothetical protein B0O99DRAFT_617387 [Bisporella sp. PMI_857]